MNPELKSSDELPATEIAAKKELIRIADIRMDGGTQSRAEINEDTVGEYADIFRREGNMPPVVVFWDGTAYWLADGFHRCRAARKADFELIDALVSQGTLRDAIEYAAGANYDHGLKRSRADKRAAIMLLLNDEEWSQRTNKWIADTCRVSHHLVATVRDEMPAGSKENGNLQSAGQAGATGKGNKIGETRLSKNGKRRPASYARKRPESKRRAKELPSDDRQDEAKDWNIGEQEDHEELFDELNQPLTVHNKPAFEQTHRMKELEDMLRAALREMHGLAAMQVGAYISETRVESLLKNAINSLKESHPFCNCPQCNGDGCRSCRESGYITKLIYDQLPDPEQE